MKRAIFFVSFLILIVFTAVTLSSAQGKKKGGGFSTDSGTVTEWYSESIALVVGVNAYSNGWPSLSSAGRDADMVAQALSAQGFKVFLLKDSQATKSEIMRYLYNIIPPQVSENGRFLFYFSGHGQTQDAPAGALGYLVPVDGQRSNGVDQWYSYISMKELRDVFLDQYRAKHIMVVSDSCFSGLLTTKSIGVGSIVSNAMKYKGRMILTAGGRDEQAVDGLFAPVLVDALKGQADTNGDGAVTFGELALYVQQNVATKSKQRPVYGWWEGNGEMVFKSKLSKTSDQGSVVLSPSISVPINKNDISSVTSLSSAQTKEIFRKGLFETLIDQSPGRGVIGKIQMSIKNKNGDELIESLIIRIKQDSISTKSIITFLSPNEVRGRKVLIENTDISFYIPELKRIKKITTQNIDEHFMGTDFTYRDLLLLSEVNTMRNSDSISRNDPIKGHGTTIILTGKNIESIDDSFFTPSFLQDESKL